MLVNLADVLAPAQKNGYAVGLFNAVNVEQAKAIIGTAERLRSPVIVGTAEVLLPFGSLFEVANTLLPMAREASVPVVLHYDHGLTFEKCMEALKRGFTSIMYDCSTLDYESNLANIREMVKICHSIGASVEGELGHVGDNFGAGELARPEDYFTDPDKALEYVEQTGIDALAIAVGNAHGDYKFPPKLDFDRIATIAGLTNVPLVLHGGSGLTDSDFREAIRRGICKVNIFTDIDKAGLAGAKRGIENGAKTLSDLVSYEVEAISSVVENKMTLFGSVGKA